MGMGSRPCALVISPGAEGWFLPALFVQAGWHCDVVSLVDIYSASANVRALYLAQAVGELADFALRLHEQGCPYDWVVPTTDDLLGELCLRSRLDPRFLSLLPVDSAAARAHLFSKINLSRFLDRHGVPTPRWAIASSCADALAQVEEIGYPCFLKRDRSSGGGGTAYCQLPADVALAARRFSGHSFLLQQAIDGELWSVEALYWHGKLRSFSLSLVLDTLSSCGPSLSRRYGVGAELIPDLVPLLEGLGGALSAHGLANISLLRQAETDALFCIEADLRPNAWVALDQYLGGDFARAIHGLLEESPPPPPFQCYSGSVLEPVTLTHFQRLLQIGAPAQDVQRALCMQPSESSEFMEKLVHRKFYIPLSQPSFS